MALPPFFTKKEAEHEKPEAKHVIEDSQKFSIALGVPISNDLLKDGILSVLAGVAVGVGVGGALAINAAADAAAALAAFTASLSVFGKISLAFFGTLPVAAVAIPLWAPILASLGVAIGTWVVIGGVKKIKPFNTYEGHKSFNTPLDRLGHTIASIIFVPLIGFALSDGDLQEDEQKFVVDKMKQWGYSQDYVDYFIRIFSTLKIDAIKRSVRHFKKWLGKLIKTKKVNRKDIHPKDLKKKSLEMCKELYAEHGTHTPVEDEYIKFLQTQ